jgi:hypothetical protein
MNEKAARIWKTIWIILAILEIALGIITLITGSSSPISEGIAYILIAILIFTGFVFNAR